MFQQHAKSDVKLWHSQTLLPSPEQVKNSISKSMEFHGGQFMSSYGPSNIIICQTKKLPSKGWKMFFLFCFFSMFYHGKFTRPISLD